MNKQFLEEKVLEYRTKMGEIGMRRDWQIGDEWIRTALTTSYTEGFTAGVEKARELVDKHDPSTTRKTAPLYWGNTLRRALTQLTSTNEVK